MNNAKREIQMVGVQEVREATASSEPERANQDKGFTGARCRPSLSKMPRKRGKEYKRPVHTETRKGWGFQSLRKSKETYL